MIHIFHHRDADGYAAAAVIGEMYLTENNDFRENTVFYDIEHNADMPLNNIGDGDTIYILDYSFSRKNDQERLIEIDSKLDVDIIWIDHHRTSKKIRESDIVFEKFAMRGLVDERNIYSGCMLAYIWRLRHLGVKLDDEDIVISFSPYWLQLISDYDTWSSKFQDSNNFIKGLEQKGLYNSCLDTSNPNSLIMLIKDLIMLIKDRVPNPPMYTYTDSIVDEYISDGKFLTTYDNAKNQDIVEHNSFELELDIYGLEECKTLKDKIKACFLKKDSTAKILCLNGYGNSLVFGDRINNYDAVCLFRTDGEKYLYTMYSDEYGLDCGIIATYFNRIFGIAGGGHRHAAGWTAPKQIFYKDGRCAIKPNKFISYHY